MNLVTINGASNELSFPPTATLPSLAHLNLSNNSLSASSSLSTSLISLNLINNKISTVRINSLHHKVPNNS